MTAPIYKGETGWRAYALQAGLRALAYELGVDGTFGPETLEALRKFQGELKLAADGVAGPQTQGAILSRLSTLTHRQYTSVPDGLMRGFCESEGGNMLAPTNWSVPGGVDCGCMQWRVYGPPYDLAQLKARFDPAKAMTAAAVSYTERVEKFRDGAWVRVQGARRDELAKRCAAMAHNWPSKGGADFIAEHGVCSNADALCTWVSPGTKFPDGTPVRTRWEWCQFYAMGSTHGASGVTKYVRDWF